MKKNYLTPQLTIVSFRLHEQITTLHSWLEDQSLENSGIATYLLAS